MTVTHEHPGLNDEFDVDHELSHCAKYSEPIMERLRYHLTDAPGPILDCFAGTGRIHELGRDDTVGVEIEPEWANMHDRTMVGDATKLTDLFEPGSFGTVTTSPTYANRLSDSYDGRDGSSRMSYRLSLGRDLTANNSGGMQWDHTYRDLHRTVYQQLPTILQPDGLLLLNMKDHRRDGHWQHVTDWHLRTLLEQRFSFITAERIECPGNGHGANLADRIEFETLLVMRAPGPQLSLL